MEFLTIIENRWRMSIKIEDLRAYLDLGLKSTS